MRERPNGWEGEAPAEPRTMPARQGPRPPECDPCRCGASEPQSHAVGHHEPTVLLTLLNVPGVRDESRPVREGSEPPAKLPTQRVKLDLKPTTFTVER